MLPRTSWQYVAGFFDGEGSLTHNGKGWRITIPQTHFEVLETIRCHAGYGTVFLVTKRQPHWKESWVYVVSRQEYVSDFLERIEPHLIVKRREVSNTLPVVRSFARKIANDRVQYLERKRKALVLRQKGLTYRAIGQRIGMDWSWVRKMIARETV